MTPDQHLTTVLSGVTSVHSYYLTSLINLSFCRFDDSFFLSKSTPYHDYFLIFPSFSSARCSYVSEHFPFGRWIAMGGADSNPGFQQIPLFVPFIQSCNLHLANLFHSSGLKILLAGRYFSRLFFLWLTGICFSLRNFLCCLPGILSLGLHDHWTHPFVSIQYHGFFRFSRWYFVQTAQVSLV